MSDREVVYLNGEGVVVNTVVVGDDDPDVLLDAYGYAEWLDRSEAQQASVGWRRVGAEWIPPSPFPSWIWADGEWAAPAPRPDSSATWDEETQEWVAPAPDPRASAIAKLEALGLSPEEAAAIAGSV